MIYHELYTELISYGKVLEFCRYIIENNPKLFANPEFKREFTNIQKSQIQKTRELLDEASKYTKQVQLYNNPFYDPSVTQQDNIPESLEVFKNPGSALAINPKSISAQSIYLATVNASEQTTITRMNETLHQQEPIEKEETCLAPGSPEQKQYSPLVQDLSNVCEQVSKTVKELEALNEDKYPDTNESIIRVLKDLIRFVEDTRERFYDEYRRYQVLARIRKILREHLFDYLPTGSANKRLVTAIINATNRTTAKNFRKKYIGIFEDSLKALRDGQTDPETMTKLEKKLLEIDDEL